MSDLAQTWHAAVEGTWHGLPSIFDAEGNHLGTVRADRSIFVDGDQRMIRVATTVDCTGPLRARLEHPAHLLRVAHKGNARVYEGVDFVGAGYPYGTLVLGQDYCIPWTSDNRVTVHVLPDGKTQAYSTVLYQGPAIHAVINGIYVLSHDYATNAETARVVDAHVATERQRGSAPHVLPARDKGAFRGEVEVYDAHQTLQGRTAVSVTHTPTSLQRADVVMNLGGVFERPLAYSRYRHENKHFYEGPDLFGNAIGYGRALFTIQHVFGHAARIRGREFLMDDKHTMSVVWEIFRGDRVEQVLHGVLRWEPS